MRKEMRHRKWMWVGMVMLALMVACSPADDAVSKGTGTEDVPTVNAMFTFSFPSSIVTRHKKTTRMTGEIVQEGAEAESFRGIDDVHMLCFDQYPTESSKKLGKEIELKTNEETELDETADTDYSMAQEIRVPVGTSHFAFYARAADAPKTHEQKMHYGIIEAVGISANTYTDNSSIRFRPVPICPSIEPLGGSEKGKALLQLLNDLVNITGPEAAPNDKWATVGHLYLNEAYQQLTSLRTLSSFNVQLMLGYINQLAHMESVDGQGDQLAAKIVEKIASCCVQPTEEEQEEAEASDTPEDYAKITLLDQYQGFPDDIHLPAGAARIVWDEEEGRFRPPYGQDYGKGLVVESLNDYAYPMNLQYQVFSDILASDSLVLLEKKTEEDPENPSTEPSDEPGAGDEPSAGGDEPSGDDPSAGDDPSEEPAEPAAKTWNEMIDSLYTDAQPVVSPSTQSVAMVKQVQYAVGRLALRARIDRSATMYDAKGKTVEVKNGFTLKGYIVGGQREVDYDFQPVETSRFYAIYDTDLNEGTTDIKRRSWSNDDHFNYILGLGTVPDQPIYLALELVNNCEAFQGADGVIAHGATFYLVGAMVPSEGDGYNAGSLDQIFNKDFATEVSLTIKGGWPDKDGDGVPDPDLDDEGNPKPLTGLATATYGMPDMQVPHPTVGVSVDLSWGEGLFFDDVEL